MTRGQVSMIQKIKKVALPLVLVLVVGAGTFYLGTFYQKARTAATMGMRGQFGNLQRPDGADGLQRRFFDQQQGRPFTGEIIAKDEKSITIKLRDGSSKIIMLPDKATIRKFTDGTKDDLKQGEQVFVTGEENSDGSVTANTVQIGNLGIQ
jgi:hypothetical protein